jgi:hypothetical protein
MKFSCLSVWLTVWATAGVACSDAADDPVGATKTQERSNRMVAEKPALEPVTFEMEPVTIAPGTEAMHCYYLPPLEQDLVVRGFSTKQGPGGHHFVIYRAIEPKPAGTIEDCSSGESMKNLLLVLTQTGTQEPGASAIEFPDNHAMVLKAGLQLVAQSHYINATDDPVETGDTLRIDTTKADLATLTQLHLFVAGANGFEIPALTEEYSTSAGCELDKDIKLLSLVPHMHELGKRIELRMGVADDMKAIMAVQEWSADMRDLPPITSFNGPKAHGDGNHAAGQSVALTCTWHNTSNQAVKFPAEMCAAVGYFTTEVPDASDIICITPLPAR